MSSKRYSLKHILFVFLIIAVIFISGCASQQPAGTDKKTPASSPAAGKSSDTQSTGTDASKLVPPAIPE